MGDWAKPLIAMHCFDNLVQFISIHKFDTDTISLQWKSMMLNVMLSGVANLQHVNDNQLRRHRKLDIRTIQKYKCALPLNKIKFPERSKKAPSNCWEKRPGGLELITKTKKYWHDHLVTSPKKNDLVFKHVRGEGKHTIVEINGLKELACAAGGSGFSCTEVFTNNCFHNLFIPILFVLVQMLDVNHTRELSVHTQ